MRPRLRRADIGIAMGQRGTDVARATADLVLLDDNFASIVATVREGRHIFQNIQRAFLYLIAFHVPIVALAMRRPDSGCHCFCCRFISSGWSSSSIRSRRSCFKRSRRRPTS